MKIVRFVAEVQEAACNGCRLCEPVCPTGAVEVIDGKSGVEAGLCIACTRCSDRCTESAITMAPRSRPLEVGTSVADLDAGEVAELCRKAHRRPGELVCVCTGTFVEEIAAAILEGARSVRDVARRTGALSGCQEFCVPVVQRMLKACGVDIARAGGPLPYDQTFSLWDVAEELGRKYPVYCFREDAELARRLRKA